MKNRSLHISAAAIGMILFAAAGPASAQVVVNFETETAGAKPNGYTADGITFNDTSGANLQVNSYGDQGVDTKSLAVFGDDASGLEMLFDSTSSNLSLTFGNDDPSVANAGDVALLRIFMGATQVGQTSVAMNRDDIANQTIGIDGINFNRATFFYTNAAFNPIDLIEVVDNITYTAGAVEVAAVPEPATWAMMLMGFGAVGGALRRRQTVTARIRFA